MMQPVSSAARADRPARSPAKPVARAGTQINAKIVWALCALALSGAVIATWTMREPARDAVVLSPQTRAAPQGFSEPSMAQFPGLVSPPSLPPPVVAAQAALVAQPLALAAELSRVRAESAAVTAGASSVPVSTWPAAVARGPNEVAPRSDMRYQVNTPPPR